MDIAQLKELIKKLGRILVMDGDKPVFVILAYQDYIDMTGSVQAETAADLGSSPASVANTEPVETAVQDSPDEARILQLNEEIAILRQEVKQRETEELLAQQG